MGNTASIEDAGPKHLSYLKSRRQSNRSIMSAKQLNSASSNNNDLVIWPSRRTAKSNSSLSFLSEGQQQSHHHGIISRLKNKATGHKNHHKGGSGNGNGNGSSHSINSTSSTATAVTTKHHLIPYQFDSSIDDLMANLTVDSSTSTLLYTTSPQSNQRQEIPIIEKYTDSQMSLFFNHTKDTIHHHHQPQDGAESIYNESDIISTHAIIDSNTTCHEDQSGPYSSELLLKELFMLYETSPERRRDRDRRHRQHYLLKRTWGSNYKIPLKDPSLIIHWCCATAVWDVELAFEFPNAKVIGIDYQSATVSSLTDTVNNFSFHNAIIHEGESGLNDFKDNEVDYIMMRDVSIVNAPSSKWTQLFKEIYRILKPGGYIEIYEQDANFESMGPNLTLLEQWADRVYEAIQFDRQTNKDLGLFLRDAGYVNVKEESIQLPIGEWPESKELRETGYLLKDLTERRFREAKRWCCKFNHITEKEYLTVVSKAIDECDDYNTTVYSLYYSAQKPY
ncbi:S-adenosyl-L-methionine-dependent methyltransferase [Cokeromyces recurvatus]|uniref:S-adenosyl-L-methionine-dependent methyltransferase n=1 Tax=Cokeromyces recurvatus TaxID=90255 RepID=UPI00221E49A7|nr:S-adenosyl-L-methionine-dependent methyltransferase [Cokeromyces recurvatus]KAI7901530.1 S-adenosyl-L-methionine-dependent methyltransferase [Cokeromyces recurvatus]